MYFCKSPRTYVLTRQERDSGIYFCPTCGKVLKKGNLSKFEKLFQCRSCSFKITGRDIMPEYPNQKVVVDIGIELQKVAKVITADKTGDKEILKYAEKKAHEIFEKAKRETRNSSLDWKIKTEIKTDYGYKFFANANGFSDSIWIEVGSHTGTDLESGFQYIIDIKAKAKPYLNVSTSQVSKFQRILEETIRRDFSKIFIDEKEEEKKLMREVKEFIKNRFSLIPEEEEKDELFYATRDHGDVGEEKAGKEDIELMKNVMRETKSKFQDLKFQPEIIDEWVNLTIKF